MEEEESAGGDADNNDIDILGNVIEDPIADTGLYYWDEDDEVKSIGNKEYMPDPNSILVRILLLLYSR